MQVQNKKKTSEVVLFLLRCWIRKQLAPNNSRPYFSYPRQWISLCKGRCFFFPTVALWNGLSNSKDTVVIEPHRMKEIRKEVAEKKYILASWRSHPLLAEWRGRWEAFTSLPCFSNSSLCVHAIRQSHGWQQCAGPRPRHFHQNIPLPHPISSNTARPVLAIH